MDKIKTFFKAVLTILKSNAKRPNFWVSFFTLGLVAFLVYLKLFLKVDITSSSVLGIITLVGILISLFGQMLGNKEVESAGENLDSTKIAKTADTIATTVTALKKQVESLTTKQTAIAKAVNADTSAPDVVASVKVALDSNGNVSVSKVSDADADTKTTETSSTATNTSVAKDDTTTAKTE